MSVWRFIVRLFGGTPHVGGDRCPRCGFSYKWDGRRCEHCGYPGQLRADNVRRQMAADGLSVARPTAAPPVTSAASPPQPAPPPRKVSLEGLDLGQFAPMTDAEAFAQAGGQNFMWGNPWFGRRDLIPPTSDKRTLLIDRAMVGHGMITPEELVEIHDVGQQMDKVRPDLLHASHIADQAVQADREAREELKRQKKAEAAERKRQHAEAVARRKATDIVFLGRGVSGGLADRRANVERLQQNGLPVMATPADVAEALELAVPRLRWLAYHNDAATRTHYVTFTVPKRSGGTRQLAAPHRDLAAAQRWVLDNVLAKAQPHTAAHGFVAGRSTVTNAMPHVNRAIVVNMDLKDFFPTVTFPRVKGVFQWLGYSPAVATVFALLCTESPRRTVTYAGQSFQVATGPRALPQGACTSPALSNLVSRRLDSRLTGIAEKLGWSYTRYADDLTFSNTDAESDRQVGYLMARIRHIVQDEGFAVNAKKSRVLRRSTRQSVTGVVVNDRPGVSRQVVRRMRAILHRAKFEGLAAQNREGRPHFESWVRGMIAYIQMVNPQQGRPLAEALASLDG